jgi:hypothetical protein
LLALAWQNCRTMTMPDEDWHAHDLYGFPGGYWTQMLKIGRTLRILYLFYVEY